MGTTNVEGIFNLLLFGFGLTGPIREMSEETTAPISLPTEGGSLVTGSLTAQTSASIELAPIAVLSLLRGLFSLDVCLRQTRAPQETLESFDSDISLLAAQFLQSNFGGYLTTTSDLSRRVDTLDRLGTEGFYGLGDALAMTLAHFSKLSPQKTVEDRAVMVQISHAVERGLTNHSQRSIFERSISRESLSGKELPEFAECNHGPLVNFLSSAPLWSFWREWYQGFLDGKPLDWELQRRVALIPDADWALGPEHIAEKIEHIRAGFEAQEAARALRDEVTRLGAASPGMGHNRPPEEVECLPLTDEDHRILGSVLMELAADDQLEKASKESIKGKISVLTRVREELASWAAKAAETARDKSAEHAGLAVWFSVLLPLFDKVIGALLKLLGF